MTGLSSRQVLARASLALLAVFAAARIVPAAEPPRTNRWEKDIQAFEAADKRNLPPEGAVLFVGSSTIRMWKTLEQDFPGHKVINRGFGGCQIEDCTRFADRIVTPYKPRLVVLRVGGNDIAAGKTPQRVFEDYKAFVAAVWNRLPTTPIAYMSINASPSRWANADREKEVNRLICQYVEAEPARRLKYIDTFDATMDSEGRPREELFLKDRLHFNAEGYRILADRVRPCLK